MDIVFNIALNEKLFIRDPEKSELGRRIFKYGIELIDKLGFEAFNFKKLAEEIHTTEASIYRYFENKHRLLLYIITWYWHYLEYQFLFSVHAIQDAEAKIRHAIYLLTTELDDSLGTFDFDRKALYHIVISESSKAYLLKDVDDINKDFLYKPYKDLCARIADLFLKYNPAYEHPHSLASTVVEAAHFQYFFAQHLPRLTDVSKSNSHDSLQAFLSQLVFSVLSKPLKT